MLLKIDDAVTVDDMPPALLPKKNYTEFYLNWNKCRIDDQVNQLDKERICHFYIASNFSHVAYINIPSSYQLKIYNILEKDGLIRYTYNRLSRNRSRENNNCTQFNYRIELSDYITYFDIIPNRS